jgi:hypothetical protein
MNNDICELSLNELEAVSGGAVDGISRLIAVTQMKSANANDAAMAGGQQQSVYIGRPASHFWR